MREEIVGGLFSDILGTKLQVFVELGTNCLVCPVVTDCQAQQAERVYARLNIRESHGNAWIDEFFPASL